jgi:hypothetical protein
LQRRQTSTKRDSRLTKAVDTALSRGVDQQNREDARQDNSVERGADFIGRTAQSLKSVVTHDYRP